MASHPDQKDVSQAPSERAFVLFWMSYIVGLFALLLGISGVSLLMR